MAKLAPLFSRFGILLFAGLPLLLAPPSVSAGSFPELALWLYAARVASWSALALALPCSLLYAIERSLDRGRWLATALFVALLVLLVSPLASHLASGDGLRARGISAALVERVVLVLIALLGAAVWTYRYWARARFWDVALGGLFCLGLLSCAAILRRGQMQLAALLEGLALLLAVLVLHVALASKPRALQRVAGGAVLSVAVLLTIGLFAPTQLARGRRLALLTESTLGVVSGQLVPGPEESAPTRDAASCARTLQAPHWPAWTAPPEQRRNVILISIDTLRADAALRRRKDGSPLMPGLQGFMAESRRAERAHAAYPATLLSLGAAFTGNAPTDLLLASRPYPTLFALARQRVEKLEAVLPNGHYFSRPDVAAYLLRDLEVHEAGAARRVTRQAIDRLRELRANGTSHLMWVHYFEPHSPYRKHTEYDVGDSDEARYESELAYVDEHLSQLLQVLREEGWYEDSLIVLFADHGESFGEHGHYHHHYLVYPWLVSVPFGLHAPGLAPGTFTGPVHLTDITPTVLQFLGLGSPRPMRGLPLLMADPPKARVLLSEEIAVTGRLLLDYRQHPVRSEAELLARLHNIEHGRSYVSKLALAQSGLQLVQHRPTGAVELYDMQRDPRAEHDLVDADPKAARALSEQLLALRRDMLLRALCDMEMPGR